MADKAHILTDKKLEEMERHLSAIYSDAQKDIQKKADEYFDKFKKADEEKRKLVKQGKLTDEEYKTWRQNKIMYGKRFTAMKEDVAKQLLNVNQTATAYINGELPEVYTLNYNALAETVDGVGGYSFTLTDRDTVKHLATTDKSLLPFRELDPAKDIPWNMKKINGQVLQGIVQGESIPKISKRIMNVQEMNKDAAIRSARTIVTGAENKGRLDSFKRAEADGIILQKEWLSSDQPGRTRKWHLPEAFDSLIVDIDKPFHNGEGDIMFPGDPSASGANVYNCRCSMASVVKGFKKAQVEKAMEENERQQTIVRRRQEYFAKKQQSTLSTEKETKTTREIANEIQDRWIKRGYADKVFLPSDMDLGVIKSIEDKLDSFIDRGYPKVRNIVYQPKECALRGAVAFYDEATDSIMLGSKFKLTDKEYSDLISAGFNKAKQRALEREYDKYAKIYISEGYESLKAAKSGYEKNNAWNKIRTGYQLQSHSSKPSVAETLADTFTHEFGHSVHLKSDVLLQGTRKKEYGEWNTYSFTQKTVEPFIQATEISTYASSSPLEAVAEAFVAREKGLEIPSIYKSVLEEIDMAVIK